MKKMTILLFTLMVTMLLSGCSASNKIMGSDAAKKLLAEERLDADFLKNAEIDLYVDNARETKGIVRMDARRIKGTAMSKPSQSEKKGDIITWSNFGDYSSIISFFDNYVDSVERQAVEGGETIEDAKDKIRANNIWIRSLFYDSLLQVNQDDDIVIRRNDEIYEIVRRTLSEQGDTSYEVYQGDVNNTYGSRIRKLGDFRYEWSYSTENDYEQYFVADKSRGYWLVQVPLLGSSFSTSVIKDDMCYEVVSQIGSTINNNSIRIATPDGKCDIVNFVDGSFEFYAGAFSNIKSVTLEVSEDEIVEYSNLEENMDAKVVYDKDTDEYFTIGNGSPILTTESGISIKESDSFVNGNVTMFNIEVYGTGDGMIPMFELIINGDTLDEKIKNLELFFKEVGLTCNFGNESVFNSIKTAYNEASITTESIEWNGVILDSIENYQKAKDIEKSKNNEFIVKYDEVKGNSRVLAISQGKLDKKVVFPNIINSSFDATYRGNVVEINTASAKINDSTLFDNGGEYNLKFALAEYNETKDEYVELLPIEVNNSNYLTYNGQEEFTVTAKELSFTLPVPKEGTFELVVYIANKEGIRVTRPQMVKFKNIQENEISLHNYTAHVFMSYDNSLSLISKTNNNVVLEIENAKETYTYDELYKLLFTEAYKYGNVLNSSIEVMSSSGTWDSISENSNKLTGGTYRLAFLNSNNEQSYVTVTY